jgi:hypothetical protein
VCVGSKHLPTPHPTPTTNGTTPSGENMRIHFKHKLAILAQPNMLVHLNRAYKLKPLHLSLNPQTGEMNLTNQEFHNEITPDEYLERQIVWVLPAYTDPRSIINWAETDGLPLLKTICANHSLYTNEHGHQAGQFTPEGRRAIAAVAKICEAQTDNDPNKRPFKSWTVTRAHQYLNKAPWPDWNLEPNMNKTQIDKLVKKIVNQAANEGFIIYPIEVKASLKNYIETIESLTIEA